MAKKTSKGFELPAHEHIRLASEGIGYNRDVVKINKPFAQLKQMIKEKQQHG